MANITIEPSQALQAPIFSALALNGNAAARTVTLERPAGPYNAIEFNHILFDMTTSTTVTGVTFTFFCRPVNSGLGYAPVTRFTSSGTPLVGTPVSYTFNVVGAADTLGTMPLLYLPDGDIQIVATPVGTAAATDLLTVRARWGHVI